MKEVLLLKCGEIVLKGLNRKTFEDRLLKNLKRRMAHVADCEITMRQSVVYVEIPDDADADAVMECASRVFGFATISRAAVCPEKTLESVIATAKDYLAPNFAAAKTFKVESKRGDKKFPMTSTEISQHVGGELADLFPDVRPDMHHPDLTVHVEMREKYAFVHAGPVPGAGGMPIGSNGRAALLLSGGIDSPVAGWMMAKRGLELCGIHFFSYPYTSERAKEKVLELGRKLTAWCGRMSVMVGSNLPAIGGTLRIGGKGCFVAESCEYCNSFLRFAPTVAVILNVEEDHLDFFKDINDIIHSFHEFAELTPMNGLVVVNGDDPHAMRSVAGINRVRHAMDVPIEPKIAGLLCSAILSDTLMFRSPTCTPLDRAAAEELAQIAGLDIKEYATEMFRAWKWSRCSRWK